MKLIPVIILLGIAQLAVAQSTIIVKQGDSLTNLLKKDWPDTTRIHLLAQISRTWISRDPQKAIDYSKMALALAEKTGDPKRIMSANTDLGYQYGALGRSVEAIKILQLAIHQAQELNDPIAEITAVAFIAIAYRLQGDLENALKYARQAFYYCARNPVEDPAYQQGYIGTSMNLGEVFLKMESLDSALYFLNISYKTFHNNNEGNRFFAFHIPILIGEIYLRKNDPERAFDFIREGFRKAKALGDNTGIVEGNLEFARYYKIIGKSDSMVSTALMVINDALPINKFEPAHEASLMLRKWYLENNNLSKALYYSELANSLKDSLMSRGLVQESQKLTYQEEEYQQGLSGAKAAYRNRLIRYLLLAGLGIVLLLAIILYLNNRRKKKDNLLLQKEIKLKEAEFAAKLADTEMTALRAQMNPHFIFNCLNSIKLYTLENDSILASDYLTKFSRLIRLVLENSRSQKLTLENELETLGLYVEMESMRFKNKVRYNVEIDENVDTQFIEVPPLLLQPYVENAIWHGLMHKEDGGLVSLHLSMKEEDILLVSIEDDGIGRAAAQELMSKSATHSKSFGLKLTTERIGLINRMYNSDTHVKIYDLVDHQNLPAGTRIEISIPV